MIFPRIILIFAWCQILQKKTLEATSNPWSRGSFSPSSPTWPTCFPPSSKTPRKWQWLIPRSVLVWTTTSSNEELKLDSSNSSVTSASSAAHTVIQPNTTRTLPKRSMRRNAMILSGWVNLRWAKQVVSSDCWTTIVTSRRSTPKASLRASTRYLGLAGWYYDLLTRFFLEHWLLLGVSSSYFRKRQESNSRRGRDRVPAHTIHHGKYCKHPVEVHWAFLEAFL